MTCTLRTVIAAFLLLCAGPAFADPEADCKALVYGLPASIEGIIKLSGDRKAKLAVLFNQTVDREYIGRHAAGLFWHHATNAQREAYLKAYVEYLPDLYLNAFSDEDLDDLLSITITKFAPATGGEFDAEAFITQKGEDGIRVVIATAHDATGKCAIRDFTAGGVSILASQTEEIRTLGASGGLPYITQKLEARKAH